jgi:hypothetical protein
VKAVGRSLKGVRDIAGLERELRRHATAKVCTYSRISPQSHMNENVIRTWTSLPALQTFQGFRRSIADGRCRGATHGLRLEVRESSR